MGRVLPAPATSQTSVENAGWAPDGSPAVWKTGCIETSGFLGMYCLTHRSALYGFDILGEDSRVLAVVGGADTDGTVAFSPDGLRVAYIVYNGSGTGIGAGIFVHDVQ